MHDIQFIDDIDAAAELATRLQDATYLAVDTEFVRERTYYPRPCLLQLAWEGHIACIDVIALGLPEPIHELLTRPTTIKVFHAARQDLELFHVMCGAVPAPVFDTQIAAAMLGFPEQCGYGPAVERILGRKLEKGHARTDWSKRPLSERQLQYAADDVRYLVPLYQRLLEKLESSGRSGWPLDDFAALVDPALYTPDPATAYRRIKSWKRFRGVDLARLQALAAWREEEAIKRDKPRKWILADDAVLELVRRHPGSEADLGRLDTLPGAVARRHGATLLELLANPPDAVLSDNDDPQLSLSKSQSAMVSRLNAIVDRLAKENEVAPAMLAPRAEIKSLVSGQRAIRVLTGWRLELVGHRLLAEMGETAPC
jgi:ribonuclease D